MYLHWSLWTLYLLTQVRVTVGNSGLFCVLCLCDIFQMVINSLVGWVCSGILPGHLWGSHPRQARVSNKLQSSWKKTPQKLLLIQSQTQNLQLTFLLLPPDLTEKQSPYIPGIKPPLDAITWLYNIYIYIYMQWITAKHIYNIQHSNFLIDDRLYSTIFHSLEQTRWPRTWFYMSD